MKECCAVKMDRKAGVCPECGQKGKKVSRITPFQLVKREFQKYLNPEIQYYFCKAQECSVVYFSAEDQGYLFKKEQIRVRVGQKEREAPIQVCYCFDYTEEDILEEMRTKGESHAFADITQKVKNGLCACEVKNPEGRCCLGNVDAATKKAQ